MSPLDADVDPGSECGLIIRAFLLHLDCIHFKASFL